MKKLLMALLLVMLGACSKSDGDLTLSCYGTNILNAVDKTSNRDDTRNCIFVGKKLAGYECEWSSKTIVCYEAKDDSEKRSRSHLIYEKLTGSFVELHTERASLGNALLGRNIFIGKCATPIFN
ncbi:hypothetical protein [Polynucleobacter sp. AP-Nino-20-G2]|uniref:hypothetical protein n=1 Tax=Polynucleobacter sp. AP-Nino-20-G2 TaxID=2576917 RepID=UPI001BFEBA28|nr:hypothetical protein [Polynucleobacter sp. AP-Nino-20-G2]QWE16643.1 hypothetical protein FD960_10320 [Polynucleobacter sp. AP-Nino-20-G2]